MLNKNGYTLGIDVGGTKVAFGLFDLEHKLLDRERISTRKDCSAEELLAEIAAVAMTLPERNGYDPDKLLGVGVGFPSFIDIRTGYIIITSAIPSLKEVEATRILARHFKAHVAIGNDAHCGALAEHAFGAGRGFDNMLYIPFSTGIGSAIILDGQLRRGAFGTAGESGHTIATPHQGEYCGCGNQGCFMSYISGQGIVSHIKTWLSQGQESIMLEMAQGDPDKIDGIILTKAADAGDQLALKALNQMITYMGQWLYNLYLTFNVNCFVFGGGLVNLGERFFKPVREEFDKYLIAKPRGEIHFKFAELGNDFGIVGAEQLLYMDNEFSLAAWLKKQANGLTLD